MQSVPFHFFEYSQEYSPGSSFSGSWLFERTQIVTYHISLKRFGQNLPDNVWLLHCYIQICVNSDHYHFFQEYLYGSYSHSDLTFNSASRAVYKSKVCAISPFAFSKLHQRLSFPKESTRDHIWLCCKLLSSHRSSTLLEASLESVFLP